MKKADNHPEAEERRISHARWKVLWTRCWREFIKRNPQASRYDTLEQLEKMKEEFGITE
jgi:hypothetical protein